MREVHERALHGDDGCDVGEARVEALKTVEDEHLIQGRSADVSKVVGEGLQVVAVRSDHEVTLHYAVDLCLEVDGEGHLIVEEDVGDERRCLVRRLILRHDDVKDLIGDGVIEP